MEQRGGLGLCGTLFVVFVVLKLCDVITWSWSWVTSPIWGAFLFGMIVFLIVASIASRKPTRPRWHR